MTEGIPVRFIGFILMIGSYANAQSGPNDEAQPAPEYTANFIQPAALPATPQPQRVIDKKFMLVMGVLGTAETMRLTTRHLVLVHEQAEGAPWATTIPSHSHLVVRSASIFAVEMLVAYEIKKRHDWLPGDKVVRKLWWIYPAAAALIDFKLAAHTMQLRPPSGCTEQGCP
jgi:hypothetical protein